MGLFDKIKSGIKYVIDNEKHHHNRRVENAKSDKALEKYDAELDAFFNERAGYYINLCKQDQLKGSEQDLIDVLFDPFEIDLSNVSTELKRKILKICSKNKDLIAYICKIANCTPDEICFDEYVEDKHTVVFGDLCDPKTSKKNPRYIFGNVTPFISGGNYAGIEYVGGNIQAWEGNDWQAFPDLKIVKGNVWLPNATTKAPKLEEVKGSLAVISDGDPFVNLASLKHVGKKFYLFDSANVVNRTWKKFEEERYFYIQADQDDLDCTRWFMKIHELQIRDRAREELNK